MIERAHRRHAALLGGADVLVVVVVGEPRGGEGPAGDPPQQQRAHRLRIFQREQQGEAAARRAAADHDGQRLELRKQVMQIVGPGLVFRSIAADDDVGQPAIAPVVHEHAVAGIGDPPRQRFHVVERAPAAGGERHPRFAAAEHFVVDVHAAHFGDGHRVPPSFLPAWQSIPAAFAPSPPMCRGALA
jgi:hypothetical protein